MNTTCRDCVLAKVDQFYNTRKMEVLFCIVFMKYFSMQKVLFTSVPAVAAVAKTNSVAAATWPRS